MVGTIEVVHTAQFVTVCIRYIEQHATVLGREGFLYRRSPECQSFSVWAIVPNMPKLHDKL